MKTGLTAKTSLGGIMLLAVLAITSTGAQAALNSAPRAETWTTNGSVYAIAATSTTIYIGGDFTQVGPAMSAPGSTDWVPRKYLAAFDAVTGQATAWNPNPDNIVNTLAVSNGIVYVGGWYSTIGGQNRKYLAAIDGATGLATGWDPNPSGVTILSLAVSGTTVYAGGYFDTIGGQSRSCVAALDAATGLATTWNPGVDNVVQKVAVSDTTVYVGGEFSIVGGQPRRNFAAIDIATGQVTAWNPNPNGIVYGIAVSGSTVYTGGTFTTIGEQTRNYAAALDAATGLATDWNPAPNGDIRAMVVSGTTVYAGGFFDIAGGQNRYGVVELDSVTGQATVWNPNIEGFVLAFALSGTTVFTGGTFSQVGSVARKNFAEFRESDTTPPTGTVVINGNRSVTNSVNATLALTWSDGATGSGVSRMRFSNDGATWTAWGVLSSPYTYILPSGDGYKTVRVQFLDKANNRSATYSDYIRLDTIAPTGGILVNNNASTTTTPSVTLNLNYADGTGSGVARMRFSDDGAHWTSWEIPKNSRAYTLPAGLGYHTVRVQYLDGGNNYSPVYTDYIKVVAP